MTNADPLQNAVLQLSRFPGVGERTATRLIYWLLRQDPEVSIEIGKALCDLPHQMKRKGNNIRF